MVKRPWALTQDTTVPHHCISLAMEALGYQKATSEQMEALVQGNSVPQPVCTLVSTSQQKLAQKDPVTQLYTVMSRGSHSTAVAAATIPTKRANINKTSWVEREL